MREGGREEGREGNCRSVGVMLALGWESTYLMDDGWKGDLTSS